MSTRPLSNPHGYNGLVLGRNAYQAPAGHENRARYVVRRARGVCVNIQVLMADERELFALSHGSEFERFLSKHRWNEHRKRYQEKLALARPLP